MQNPPDDVERACSHYFAPSILNQFESETNAQVPFGHLRSFSALPIAGHNPLLDNAARLFTILHQCELHRKSVQLSSLHHELKQEMLNFQRRLEQSYADTASLFEFIPIAVYWLSLTLDQVIASEPWADGGRWAAFQLAATVVDEPILPEHFAIILERLMNQQETYIDALEFIYVCLNLGFSSAGFVKNAYFNREQIPFLLEGLYQRIQAVRHQNAAVVIEKPTMQVKNTLFPIETRKHRMVMVAGVVLVLAFQFIFYQLKHDAIAPNIQLASLESHVLSSDQISVKVKV